MKWKLQLCSLSLSQELLTSSLLRCPFRCFLTGKLLRWLQPLTCMGEIWTLSLLRYCFQVLSLRFRKASCLYKVCAEKELLIPTKNDAVSPSTKYSFYLKINNCRETDSWSGSLRWRVLSSWVISQQGLWALVLLKINSPKDIGIGHFSLFLASVRHVMYLKISFSD